MLKNIPKIVSPELLKILSEMGHGDKIVLADGNFPSESMGKNAKVVRCDGLGTPELLDAILTLFPLDTYVEHPVILMQLTDSDKGRVETPIWDEFKSIIKKHDSRGDELIGFVDRFDFYEESKTCYAIVASGESAIYANLILQKGVVR